MLTDLKFDIADKIGSERGMVIQTTIKHIVEINRLLLEVKELAHQDVPNLDEIESKIEKALILTNQNIYQEVLRFWIYSAQVVAYIRGNYLVEAVEVYQTHFFPNTETEAALELANCVYIHSFLPDSERYTLALLLLMNNKGADAKRLKVQLFNKLINSQTTFLLSVEYFETLGFEVLTYEELSVYAKQLNQLKVVGKSIENIEDNALKILLDRIKVAQVYIYEQLVCCQTKDERMPVTIDSTTGQIDLEKFAKYPRNAEILFKNLLTSLCTEIRRSMQDEIVFTSPLSQPQQQTLPPVSQGQVLLNQQEQNIPSHKM